MKRSVIITVFGLLFSTSLLAQSGLMEAFTATAQATSVKISWTTNQPATSYQVEHSKFGDQWTAIKNSSYTAIADAQTATILDDEPMAGLSYYRLRSTDTWGKEQISAAIAVRMEHNPLEFKVSPHPARGNFFVISLANMEAANKPISVAVVDLTGQVQLEEKDVRFNTNGRLALRPSKLLPTGMYVLVLQRGSQRCSHQLIIVNQE